MKIVSLLLLLLTSLAFGDNAKSVADYKAEAIAAVSAISVVDAKHLLGNEDVAFVDVREGDELAEHGLIPGATHLPRGVLEFYIDPASSMHSPVFSSGKKVIFLCESGGRSLLAAKLAKDMGVTDVVYMDGGFRAWAEMDASIERP